MKRAEVWRDRSSTRPTWCAGICHWRDRVTGLPIHLRPDYMDGIKVFPTHAAALAHALNEVGLDRKDPDPSRCPMRATDPVTTRRPRDDGWRCGDEAGHSGGHTLYSAEGESVLFAGRWVHPDEVGLTPTNPEEQP